MKNKVFLFAAIMLIIASCSTYKQGMEQAPNDPLYTKLGNLDYTFSSENVVGGNSQFVDNIIRSEVYKNIIQKNNGSVIGYINANCRNFVLKQNLMLPFLSGLSLFSLNLIGMPIGSGKAEIDLDFTLKDARGNIIKTYSYSEKGRSNLGFYYGKDISSLVLNMTRTIIDQFKSDLNHDYTYIVEQFNNEPSLHNQSIQNYVSVPTKRTEKKAKILSDVDQNIPYTNKKLENTFVLIIANEEYEFVDDVQYALNDGNTFKEYCVKTLGVPEKQVWLYKNASYGIINAGVSKMAQAMNLFDKPNAIVYYCGHGIPDEKTGDAYIIPTDGNGKNMSTCYSLNTLYKTFSSTGAANVTYFMDACFTGANKDGAMLVAARGVAREPKKEVLSGNSVVFSATSSNETAMAYDEKQHGLFTYYLLKKLQESKGDVTYEELSKYISYNVKREAFLTNEKVQTPVVSTSPAMQNHWKSLKLK